MSLGTAINNGDGISVNVNGAYGQLTTDPVTGQYVVDVNTTGHPVYGQPPQQSAVLSQSIAGIPVMTWVAGLFVLAVLMLVFRGRAHVS
jgi:hypothetical protein